MKNQPRLMLGIGFAALLVVAVVIGFLASANNDDDSTGFETAFAEVIGDPLVMYDGTDAGIGQTAPDINAQTTESEARVAVAMDDGVVRVVEFFAHWCPHCQREVPRQREWLATHPLPAGVEILAVSTGVDSGASNYPPSSWFAREDWPTPVLVDSADGAIARGFGLAGFPYYVMVDGAGRVIERGGGEMTDAQFSALIDRAAQAATGT